MLNQVFLARFEPLVAHSGAWKIPKCLGSGPLWDQKWVKSGSKTCFSKSDRGPFGMLKQVFSALLGPWRPGLAHGKSQIALKVGRFGTKKGSKVGQKRDFPKVILYHLGCSNKFF